jgi:hypothetical protein
LESSHRLLPANSESATFIVPKAATAKPRVAKHLLIVIDIRFLTIIAWYPAARVCLGERHWSRQHHLVDPPNG